MQTYQKTADADEATLALVTDEPIAQLTYNELGQLLTKKVGKNPVTGASLQTMDYAYNIRGWLTDLNGAVVTQAGPPTDQRLFGFRLAYQQPFGSGEAQWNGNISGQQWRSQADGYTRRFDYRYDGGEPANGGRLYRWQTQGRWQSAGAVFRQGKRIKC